MPEAPDRQPRPANADMAIEAGKFRVRRAARDDAADASRFFSRMGYAVLAVGAPVGVVVHPLALFVFFPIGVAMILMAAALEGKPGFIDRVLRVFRTPAFLALIAGIGWATLSVLWSPYPVSALQEVLKLALLITAAVLTVAAPRENARATDLYLFPIGVVLLMIAMAAKGLSNVLGGVMDDGGLQAGGVALAVLLFPALGGLTARGRNGYARLLLILSLAFAYIDNYRPLTVALFAGYLAMSFSISDLRRTTRELAWGAAALILLSPLIPAFAPTIAAWIFHTKLAAAAVALQFPVGGGGHLHARQAEADNRPRLRNREQGRSRPDSAAAYAQGAGLHGLVRTRRRRRDSGGCRRAGSLSATSIARRRGLLRSSPQASPRSSRSASSMSTSSI